VRASADLDHARDDRAGHLFTARHGDLRLEQKRVDQFGGFVGVCVSC
jgi:hypothetical protein